MPEGDTIYRSARTLGRVLAGAAVAGASGSGLRGQGKHLVGQTVGSVEPRGKHLLMWFDPSGIALHTHMRMSGSWDLYRMGQVWRLPPRRARAVLDVPGWAAVCFDAPVCELLSADQVQRHQILAALGPRAVDDDVDLTEARRRLDARGEWSVGEALLDQRVLAGIGNVYKSEVLFVHGVHPETPVADIEAVTRDALLATAARLLRTNARAPAAGRTTTGALAQGPPDDRLFTYGRAGRPCRRCRTPIRVFRQGPRARVTYWCPACQPG